MGRMALQNEKRLRLQDVFGISTDIPSYTYVDRQDLDRKFSHYLDSQKHIVLHGASKQGKSCLRKKNTDADHCIVVQCSPGMEHADDLWRAALARMGVSENVGTKVTEATSVGAEATTSVKATMPLFIGAKAEMNAKGSMVSTSTQEEESISEPGYLPLLARTLKARGKRLILEDFHYLPDETRHEVAFGLKALYEEGVYVVVVGIWSEQNLLTYYNGDLTGRVEEINLTWSETDLSTVLSKGEGALNIEFAPGIRQQILESSFNNVGLLQRLAEKVCMEADVYESQLTKKVISDIDFLHRARGQVVSDIRQRYSRIAGVFVEGMRADSVLHLYGRLYNELIDAGDNELTNGISLKELLERIQAHAAGEVGIRQSDLTQCLERIERLQAGRDITPLLVSYSKSLKMLFLNDREFLFYRQYSGDDLSDLKVSFVDSED
jgi:hypothetical protein